MVIALDGPAGSGKSSLAKMLARHYDFQQVDSGAIYRTYTYWALRYCAEQNIKLAEYSDNKGLLTYLKNLHMQIGFQDNRQQIEVSGMDMEPLLRSLQVTENIRYIADNPQLRRLVNNSIREMAKTYSLVADGRDIGTVVFPLADIKFFIEADLQERAKRRFKEMQTENPKVNLSQILQQMQKRDEQDKKRKFGALKAAIDAIFIDTTNQSLEVAFHSIKKIVDSRLATIEKN